MTTQKDSIGIKSYIFLILAREPQRIRDLRKKLDKYLDLIQKPAINEKRLNYVLVQLMQEKFISIKGKNNRGMFYSVNYSTVFQKFNEMFKEIATESDIKKYYFYKNKELKKIVRYFFIGYIGWSQRSYNVSIEQILQDFVLKIGTIEVQNEEAPPPKKRMTEKERQKKIKELSPDESNTARFRAFCQDYYEHRKFDGVIDFIRDLFHPWKDRLWGKIVHKNGKLMRIGPSGESDHVIEDNEWTRPPLT